MAFPMNPQLAHVRIQCILGGGGVETPSAGSLDCPLLDVVENNYSKRQHQSPLEGIDFHSEST